MSGNRGTGIFETCKRTAIVKAGEPLTLVFVGDVHHGSALHSEEAWRTFCNEYRNRNDCLFFAMGDFLDLLSATERSAMLATALHESTKETWEDICEKRIEEFTETIRWMRGRLVVALEGNHYIQFRDGTTTAQRILAKLNRGLPDKFRASYGGDCCIVWLTLRLGKSSTPRSISLALHHGVGGGRTTGSMFNSLDQMERCVRAEIYCMGDDHQRGGVPQQVLVPVLAHHGECIVEDRTIIKLRSGSFQRGYVKGKSSYVCDRAMRPANLGCARVIVTLVRHQYAEGKPHAKDKTKIEMETIA